MADEARRSDAVERLAQAIVDLADSGTETLADDVWGACAEAGSRLRRRAPGATPVARTTANLEALGRLDQASTRFPAFSYFLLSPLPKSAPADEA
jgi:hypothetical protein